MEIAPAILNLLKRKPAALLPPPSAPSILEQTNWPTGFYSFPDAGHSYGRKFVEYFNPAIAMWKGAPRLITRRREERIGPPGHNKLMMWTLNNNVPVQPREIRIPPDYYNENWEDPRAITLPGGKLLLSWCNFNLRSFAHQSYGEMSDYLTIARPLHLKYGKNGPTLKSNRGHEKNWCWFVHEGSLYCDYMLSPTHTVLEVRANRVVKEYKTDTSHVQKQWSWGEIRGGAPPVLIGHEFFCWFHSRLPWIFDQGRWFNRYYMGLLSYSSKPPFYLRRITMKPIMEGSQYDPRNEGAPLVVFPCGALIQNGEWHVVMGVNDCLCAWTRIPHEEILKEMICL